MRISINKYTYYITNIIDNNSIRTCPYKIPQSSSEINLIYFTGASEKVVIVILSARICAIV